jgi:hypothetical protein
MVMVFEGTPQEFGMDGYLKSNLDIAKDVIKKDWDMMFCVDGMERSGKSVFAMQCAYYCDNEFDLTKVCFTPYQFKKAITNAKPFSSVLYDEAFTGLSSRATMSLINRTIVQVLAEIGQKNLFIFVVMPTFFDLDKYVGLWRTRGLFHIRTAENFQRGFFDFYNSDKKKDLYVNGKKFYNYRAVQPNFSGRFPNKYMIDEDKYRILKRKSLLNREASREDKELDKLAEKKLMSRIFEVYDDISMKIKMQLMQKSASMVYTAYVQWKEDRMIAQREEDEEKADKNTNEITSDELNAPEMN